MNRLVDLIPGGVTPLEDTAPVDPSPADPVDAVFDFPDRPQPSVKETLGAMVREVVTGEEPDPEDENFWEQAAKLDAPTSIKDAFDRGSRRLNLPEPPPAPMDPALKAPKSRAPRIRSTTPSRPVGSDQFTDLFAAGMITLIAFSLGDEFQPTEEEAKDLARPLGNILARRVDLAAKMGQDANDVIAFAIAVMAYAVRVGPVASDRVREAYRDRQDRARVNRVSGPGVVPDGPIADSVPVRAHAGAGTRNGTTSAPVDALTKARNIGRGVLDRDLGPASNSGFPVADLG